ncbi:MAG: FAD-binding oxidoreductase [bacterium]
MKPQNFVSTVIKKEKFGTRFFIIELELKNPAIIEFLAGQYVSIEVKEKVRRAYSISSTPNEKSKIELCVDYQTTGHGGKFFRNLKVGDSVNFIGPLGFFVLPAETNEGTTYYFLATGSGIAPIKSHILSLYKRNPNTKSVLYFGTKFKEDILYKDVFEKLEKQHSNFKYVVTISRPDKIWKGNTEYVPALFEKDLNGLTNVQIFLCGIPLMMQTVLGILKTKKISNSQIHLEKYI